MVFLPTWLTSVRISRILDNTAPAIAHPAVLLKLKMDRRYAALGEFSGIIVGNCILQDPTAIFKGINRPLHNTGVDNFIFIYAAKPSYTYKFCANNKPAETLFAPKNSVRGGRENLDRSLSGFSA